VFFDYVAAFPSRLLTWPCIAQVHLPQVMIGCHWITWIRT